MAENDAEEGGKSGLFKKILIFGGGGILLIAIGLGVGYVVFGSSQPDPSEQIEEIIDRKMKEAQTQEGVRVSWDIGLNGKNTATFRFGSANVGAKQLYEN